MNFKFSIGRKISLGFGIIIISTIIAFIITNNTFDQSKKINEEITNIYNPSVAKLNELKLKMVTSEKLINNWVNFQSSATNNDKVQLNKLTNEGYPEIKNKLENLSVNWGEEEKQKLVEIFEAVNNLFGEHEIVKQFLPDFESYNDANNVFLANYMVDQGGSIYTQTHDILEELDGLIKTQEGNAQEVTGDMLSAFDLVKDLITYLGFALFLAGVIIAFLTTRSIVRPVSGLKFILLDLSSGIFPKEFIKERSDEIGEMASALRTVVMGLKQTKDFANDVGSGKFDTEYQPLSDEDVLGHALIRMRGDLKVLTTELEAKVKERTAEVVRQKEEIEGQSRQIEELYNQVTDSILYAKRIQEAILPSNEDISKHVKDFLILFRPKDIVSGDFYWFSEKNGKAILAAADCTGHGVPGALMSMIGSSLLNEVVNEKGITKPSDILEALREGVIKSLNQSGESGEQKDGMDIALLALDPNSNTLEFAGAYNPLVQVRNGEIIEVKADRQPIGIFHDYKDRPFVNHQVEVLPGDVVYIFTDGYVDQFGGPNGKKFKGSRFKSLLLSIQDKTMTEQREILNTSIEEWMGEEEQIDDILVIGIKF